LPERDIKHVYSPW